MDVLLFFITVYWLMTTLSGNVVAALFCCLGAYVSLGDGSLRGVALWLFAAFLFGAMAVTEIRGRLALASEERAWAEETEPDVEILGPDGRPLARERAWVADTASGECLDCGQAVAIPPVRCPRCGGAVF